MDLPFIVTVKSFDTTVLLVMSIIYPERLYAALGGVVGVEVPPSIE